MPFEGLESIDPFTRIRVGRILRVRDLLENLEDGESPEKYLGTVVVEWIDWGGVAQAEVPLTYPCFSNPVIDPPDQLLREGLTSSITGSSYGFLYMPSVGDLIVCGFRFDGRPIMLGYLAQNYYQQTQATPKSGSGFGSFRRIASGEYSWKSKQQAEVYLDRKGAMRFVVKHQPDEATEAPTAEKVSFTLGTVFDTATFTNPDKTAQGKTIFARLRLKDPDGVVLSDISVDEEGNISLTSAGGAILTLDSEGAIAITPGSGKEVVINAGSKGAARVDDLVSIHTTLNTLLTIIKTHTHPGVLSGGASTGPSVELSSQTIPTNVGQIADGSTKVLIG